MLITSSTKADIAFQTNEKIKSNEKIRRKLLAENAALLLEMDENAYYKLITGDESSTWASYLADNELYYSRNEVYQLTRIYSKLTRNLGIDPSEYEDIKMSRLYEMRQIVDKTNYKEWLDKARILTTYDWKIETRKAKGLLTEDDEHACDLVDYKICKKCGAKHKAVPIAE